MEHPVCYISRKLRVHEKNYSTIEKEALALLTAVRACSVYFGSSPVLVYTDHIVRYSFLTLWPIIIRSCYVGNLSYNSSIWLFVIVQVVFFRTFSVVRGNVFLVAAMGHVDRKSVV